MSLTYPPNGSSVSGTIPVQASASDNVGVIGVKFFLDGSALAGEDTSSPWAASLDTAALPNGSTHSLTAVARDAAGNSTTSSTITVTVNNAPPNPAPTLSSLAPNSADAGASSLTLTVNGANFLSGSVVRLNGLGQPTTYFSSTRLTAAVPASMMVSAGTVAVSVYSPGPGGGSSGTLNFTVNAVTAPPPPPPPPADPPPTISGVVSVSVTSSGATITWNTNESASSTVDYGTTTAYGATATGGSGTAHSVALSGLNPGTLYHFHVRSADSGGNEVVSGDFTFTTSAAAVTPPPTLSFSSDKATVVSGGNVTLTWSSTDATGCDADGDWTGPKGTAGSVVYNVTVPKTFKLLCAGLGGTIAQSLFVGLALAAPVDTAKPVLALVSGVPAITSDATPSVTFSSDEAGTILYSGDCSSAAVDATIGDNAVSFNALSSAPHSNCAIRVRDAAGNVSDALPIPAFTVDANVPTGSVRASGGAATTESSTVSVEIECTSGDCVQMRLSGDGNVDSEPTVAFAGSASVTLTPGTGVRTVKARLIDAAGNAAEVSDDIEVVAPAVVGPPPPPPPVTGALKEGFLTAPYFCVGTVIGTSSSCGDGVKGPGEICEIGEYKSVSCGAGGYGYKNVTCYNNGTTCDFQSVADSASACVPPSCGNGVREGTEQCDDGSLNGTFGHCGPDCDLNGAFYCGNATVEGSEQCDLGATNNGQYRQSPSASCSFDCKKPGPSCGDRLVNGTEACDGNSETSSDGCPTNTTKTRTCNATCTGFPSVWSACGAVCGNGKVEGAEQCDDGNTNDNDACTSTCKDNACGDGFLNQGVESCDEGMDNGSECDAPYGGVCNYCTTSCQFRTKSGGYCGDNVKNGPEACDGTSFSKSCVGFAGVIGTETCLTQADCPQPAGASGCTRTVGGNFLCPGQCVAIGACNGGANNGMACVDSDDCTNGTCALPACSSSCGSSCPVAFQTVNVSIQSEIPGSSPASEIDLYSYGNEEGFTPDNAALLLPACTVGTQLTADIDRNSVVTPSLDVVFVTDLSGSMQYQTPRKIDTARNSIQSAINDLFEAYADAGGADVRIGLVTYQGTTAASFEVNGQSLLGQSRQSALISEVGTYTLDRIGGGTPTAMGMQAGLEILEGSDADVRALILMSDGDPSVSLGGGSCSGDSCVTELIGVLPAPDEIQVYSGAITASTNLIGYMAHFSSDECGQGYSSRPDCSPRDGVEYAYDGITAAEIAAMYDAITNSVLGANVGVTHTGSGETVETTGAVSAGKDVVLPFPTNFQCQGAAFAMPLTIRFTSAPESRSTIHLEDVKFEYCPTR